MNTVSTQVSPSRAERVRVCLKKTNSPNPCNRLSREALACWYRRHACALFLEFPAGGPSNPSFQHSPPVKQRFFLGSQRIQNVLHKRLTGVCVSFLFFASAKLLHHVLARAHALGNQLIEVMHSPDDVSGHRMMPTLLMTAPPRV